MIAEELRENPALPGNFWGQAQHARKAINAAGQSGDLRATRAAAAAYGGVVKRWRGWLIEQITAETLHGCDTSRDRVREWQKELFGQSCASAQLKRYAKPERSGGGRARPINASYSAEREAAALFYRYKDSAKHV